MKCIFIVPVSDYVRTRKRLWLSYLVAIFPALVVLIYALLFNAREGINIADEFDSFVNIQISAIAILISFSIAIITILVTSDNENIRNLKDTMASNNNYKIQKGKQRLSLFQVLLSNVTYNVIVQIVYLIILIAEVFLKMVVPVNAFKYLTAINIFFIVHILYVLIESVVNMYLVFWKDFSKK